MKLYTFDPAPNPRRLQLFLDYKGIKLETQQVDVAAKEQLSDAYREINPACTVPALATDEGVVLSDVIAIVSYLESLHPEKPLLGTTALEKAQVLAWNLRLATGLGMAVAEVFRNTSKGMVNRAQPGPLDVAQIPALIERGNKRLDYTLPWLDAELVGRDWIAGDTFSFADIEGLVFVDFMGWIKREIPVECGNLKAWYARTRQTLEL